MDRLKTPVALFIFKREKAVEIVKRISQVKPERLYIIADAGRNEEEHKAAIECRSKVEAAVDWDCEIIKDYAEENRGVYGNIGGGALRVFEREDTAIFLEDDNLPEVTFFRFCEELLDKYRDDTRVLWICGTNYLEDYTPADGASYMFTKHLLPCGWASWKKKFTQMYDLELKACSDDVLLERMKDQYCDKRLYDQYRRCWMQEYLRLEKGKRPISWDYQMDFAVKANGVYGISPCKNQIKNIGVDELSIHGGTSYAHKMTVRFCGMGSKPLDFPLKHPVTVLPDTEYEKKIGAVILYPFATRFRMGVGKKIKKILGMRPEDSLTAKFKGKK